jgi:hypothetical protein
MKTIERISYLRLLLLLTLLLVLRIGATGQTVVKQGNAVPASFCISPAVMELYNMINGYRRQNELPPIQLSRSLCYVASMHVKDLSLHHPDQGPCNFHSWSAKGFWKPFCYPKDENKKNSVWDKPREITRYPSKAYEIVYWENTPLVTDTVFMVWKTEEYFNSFLLNAGKWEGRQWGAIGIAVNENYASAWFGEAADPEGAARVCGSAPPEPVKDTVKAAAVVKKPVVPVKKPAKAKVKPVAHDSLAAKGADSLAKTPSDTLAGKVTAPVITDDTIPKTYYIIVKTNISMEAATKLANTLKSKDYPDAKVITAGDKIRVSVFESPVKTTATAKLREVKRTYRDAWLFKN